MKSFRSVKKVVLLSASMLIGISAANAHTTNAQNFLIVFIFVYVYYLSFWFERELMRYTKVPYFSLAEFFLMALLMALLVF